MLDRDISRQIAQTTRQIAIFEVRSYERRCRLPYRDEIWSNIDADRSYDVSDRRICSEIVIATLQIAITDRIYGDSNHFEERPYSAFLQVF